MPEIVTAEEDREEAARDRVDAATVAAIGADSAIFPENAGKTVAEVLNTEAENARNAGNLSL